MLTANLLMLFFLISFFIFLYRLYYFRVNRKIIVTRLSILIKILLLFFLYIFFYLVRIKFYSSLFTFFELGVGSAVIFSVLEEVIPISSGTSGSSSWTEDSFLGNKMLPGDASSGASTSNQGQSSMGGQIPASTSQPTEVAHRSDPLLTAPDEIKKPLVVDDLRQKELEKRLNFHFIGKSEEIDTLPYRDLIDTQLLIEKKIEISLRNDGYSRESVLANLNAIRGYLFYPSGVPLKNITLTHHLLEMQKGNNIPYARIQRAIAALDLFLVKGE